MENKSKTSWHQWFIQDEDISCICCFFPMQNIFDIMIAWYMYNDACVQIKGQSSMKLVLFGSTCHFRARGHCKLSMMFFLLMSFILKWWALSLTWWLHPSQRVQDNSLLPLHQEPPQLNYWSIMQHWHSIIQYMVIIKNTRRIVQYSTRDM